MISATEVAAWIIQDHLALGKKEVIFYETKYLSGLSYPKTGYVLHGEEGKAYWERYYNYPAGTIIPPAATVRHELQRLLVESMTIIVKK